VQYTLAENQSRLLDMEEKKFVHQVCGTFLYYYYEMAVYESMLVALSSISSQQTSPTADTLKKTQLFLDYVASHSDEIFIFRPSNMD